MGACQNNQSWVMYSPPANRAGPVLRAGFTEVLVTGIETRWMMVSARPMGMPAKPAAAPLEVAPTMMNRNRQVSSSSVVKAAVTLNLPGLSSP